MYKRAKKSKKKTGHAGFEHIHSRDNITEFKLKKNGLRVLFVRLKDVPVVTANLVYNVGSKYELPGKTGIAHMLEHMLFKPTTTKGLTWSDLEKRGAILNATTWLDRTNYYFSLPTEDLGDILYVLADMMRNVKFTDSEFLPERSNVLSEYEMYNSRPSAALESLVGRTAFHSHGYGHDTIGFRNDIERYTTKDLKEFYDTYYWPNNATLIVVGDLKENELLGLVRNYFEKIPSATIPEQKEIIEPAQEGVRRVSLKRNTPLRILHLAFKAPAFTDKDWVYLQLAFNYLMGNTTSPLYKELVETRLATNIDTQLSPTKEPYLASIEITLQDSVPYEQVEKKVFSTIAEFLKKRLPQKKLPNLIEELYASELFSRDGSLDIAQNLNECVSAGDWTWYPEILKVLRNASPGDIQRVGKKYLNEQSATMGQIEH